MSPREPGPAVITYLFVGTAPAEWPDVVLLGDDGEWVGATLQPGDAVRVQGELAHPHLIPVADDDPRAGTVRVGRVLTRQRPSPAAASGDRQDGDEHSSEESRPAPSAGGDDPNEGVQVDGGTDDPTDL